MTDHLTILTARSGARLTKLWQADGQIAGYEDAKTFDASQVEITSLGSIWAALYGLQNKPDTCVIRGSYPELRDAAPGTVASRVLRRVESTVDTPHQWVMLDVDDYTPMLTSPKDDLLEACREFIFDKLPVEFHGRDFIAQASASAGAPGKEDVLKAHLWFWLEQPVDSVALRTWAKNWGAVDAAVFRQVQPHYVAAPLFEPGVTDPLRGMRLERSGDWDNEGVPVSFLGSIAPVSAAASTDGEDVDLDLVRGVVADYDIDRVRSDLLEHLDPNMDHDSWVMVGMALHHQFDGSDEALELWDEWSSGGASWTEDVCAERWKSFQGERNAGHGSVTLRWVIKLVKDKAAKAAAVEDRRKVAREVAQKKAERAAVEPALLEWGQKIEAAETASVIELDLAPGIRAGTWLDTDKAALIEAIWKRLKALKTPVDRRTIKKWITPPPAVGAGGGGGAAPWVKEWVYVARDKVMFNRETREMMDREAFNQAMTHKVPIGPGQTMPTAAYTYVMQFEKTVATAAVYAPPHEALFEFQGNLFANRYKPNGAPEEPESIGEEGAEYIRVVEEWLAHLVPDQRERGILISWLAHNVRRPGVKIGWAPYVHSNVHGAGKTTLAVFLNAVMGPGSVHVHRGSVLYSKFSGWETESAVALLDEFPPWTAAAREAIDPVENLKNIITGTLVSVERKGRDVAMAPSFCNVMLVSNGLGGLKVSESDRRLFYVSSPMKVEEHAALEASGFYSRLHWALAHGGGVLRKWLLDQPVHPEFGVNRRAPETAAKTQAIELSKSDLRSEIEDLLETGGPGYGGGIASVWHLRGGLLGLEGRRHESVKTRAIDFVLQEIGYCRIGKVKVGSVPVSAWALPEVLSGTGPEERKKAAAMLRATIEKCTDDAFME